MNVLYSHTFYLKTLNFRFSLCQFLPFLFCSQLNLNSSVTDQSYSKNLFQKEKPKSNLPQPIDFNKTSIEDLAKSKTKLLKEKKYKNKHEKPLENWYDMKRPELTEELETDLKALHNRGAMDSKSFYRKNDRAGHIPKHFEVARIIKGMLVWGHFVGFIAG